VFSLKGLRCGAMEHYPRASIRYHPFTMSILAPTQRLAAWQPVVGVQGLVVLALIVVGWRGLSHSSPSLPPLEGRLQAMDVPERRANIAKR